MSCGLKSIRWAYIVLWGLVLAVAILLFAAPGHAAPTFTAPSVSCAENAPCNLVILKSGKATSYSKLQVQTVDGSAKAGVDYQPVNKTITVANNTLRTVVPITLIDNKLFQPSRTFGVKITAVRNAVIASGYEPVTVTITEDDPPPPAPSTGLAGEPDVADNFNVAATLLVDPTPVVPEVDGVGAFRFTCLSGQLLRDDPIVYPDLPGKSHLHQFFGNTLTNANSTYQSLRTTGGSTCTGQDGNTTPTGQRTAYWMPAMLDGAGNVVKPNRMLTYYKRVPLSMTDCQGAPDTLHMGFCVPVPNGLRMLSGYNMATGVGGPLDNTMVGWSCTAPNGQSTYLLPSLPAIIATGACPLGSELRAKIDFPTCWDGQNIDVADHRSHVVMGTAPYNTPAGFRPCPVDHPYVIPTITMQAFYTVDANFIAGKWHLSSDEMVPGAAAGTTLHGDYWEAWSPIVKNIWETYCINAHKSCSNGGLGNGQKIKGMDSLAPNGFPGEVLVPLSSIP